MTPFTTSPPVQPSTILTPVSSNRDPPASSYPMNEKEILDAELRKFNWKVCDILALPICLQCESAQTNLDSALRHSRKADHTKLPPLFKGTLQNRLELCPIEHPMRALYLRAPGTLNNPVGALSAIPGLRIHKKGVKCPLCQFHAPLQDSVRSHLSIAHRKTTEDISAEKYPIAVPIQSIKRKPLRFFAVRLDSKVAERGTRSPEREPVASNSRASTIRDSVDHLIALNEASAGSPTIPGFSAELEADPRLSSLFYAQANFGDLISAYKVSDIVALVGPPRTSFENSILSLVRKYVRMCRGLMYTTGAHILNRFKPVHPHDNDRGLQLINDNTEKSYATCIARVIVMAIRRISSRNFEKFPPLPADLYKAATNLQDSLRADRNSEESHALNCLHEVHKCIFLSKLPSNESTSTFFIWNFIAFSTVRAKPGCDEYTLQPAKHVSKWLAKLQYACRTTALFEIRRPSCSVSPTDFDEHVNEVLGCLSTERNTAYTLVKDFLQKALSIALRDSPDPKFIKCLTHQDCHIVDGNHLSLQEFQNATKKLLQGVRFHLEKTLLFGKELPDEISSALHSPVEEMRNESTGFSFVLAKGNQEILSRQAASFLLKAIDESPHLRSHFIDESRCDSDTPKPFFLPWNTKSIVGYLNACVEFEKRILALMHITGGGSPPRGTEEYTHKLRNTPSSRRSIMTYDNLVLLALRYKKVRHLKGSDETIPHFPDLDTGSFLKTYAIVVRPLEVFFLSVLHKNDPTKMNAVRAHRDHLYVDRGVPFTDESIRSGVAECFAEVGIPFNYRHYRQFSIGVMRTYIKYKMWKPMIPLERQGGHGDFVGGRNYGRSQFSLPEILDDHLHQYLLCSVAWHKLLNLRTIELSTEHQKSNGHYPTHSCCCNTASDYSGSHKRCKTSQGNHVSDLSVKEGQSVTLDNSGALMSKECTVLSKRTHDELSKAADSARSTTKVLNLFSGVIKTSFNSQSHYPTSLGENGSLIMHLRQFMSHRNTVGFKSSHQLAAVAAALDRKEDLLVVLPTGGGKSLVFMLPAFMQSKGGKITIVVVPLVALANDLVRRCVEAGFESGTWKDRHRYPTILIIAVENLQSSEYLRYVSKLDEQGRILRVVFDEVHLTLLWCSFRTCMHSLSTLIRPGGLRVPLVMLSATVPPHVENLLSNHLGSPRHRTIRASTVRPNLRYQIVKSQNVHQVGLQIVKERLCSLLDSERVIVYSQTRGEAQKFFDSLAKDEDVGIDKCVIYHAGLDECEKLLASATWRAKHTEVRIMVATSAFGSGVDYPSVRTVLHLGFARSLVEFAQESGRAGRDGLGSYSTVVFCPKYVHKFQRASKREVIETLDGMVDAKVGLNETRDLSCYLNAQDDGICQFLIWAENRNDCRRQQLHLYLDGCADLCIFLSDAELCDVCKNKTTISASNSPSSKFAFNDSLESSALLGRNRPVLYEDIRKNTQKNLCPENGEDTNEPTLLVTTASLDGDVPTVGNDVRWNTVESGGRSTIIADELTHFKSKITHVVSVWKKQKDMGQSSYGPCVACFAENAAQHEAKSCPLLVRKCIRCFQEGHFAGFRHQNVSPAHCKYRIPSYANRCYKCGLPEFCESHMLHSRDGYGAPVFGSECPWGFAWDLSLYLWGSGKHRLWFKTNFPKSQAHFLNSPNIANFQKWLLASSEDVPNVISVFNKWFRTRSIFVHAPINERRSN